MGDPTQLDTFGKRLKAARKAAQLNQDQLAQIVGIEQGTLSDIENDKHGSTYAPEIAAAIGVEALWLKTGKGPRKRAGALDVDALRECVIGVDMACQGRDVSPERRAKLIAASYIIYAQSETKPDAASMLQLLRTML